MTAMVMLDNKIVERDQANLDSLPGEEKKKDFTSQSISFNSNIGEHVKIEPFYPRVKKMRMETIPQLPPLPLESDLFTPPVTKKGIDQECPDLLTWLDTAGNKVTFNIDEVATLLQADVKKLFLTCNVLESVQMLTKTGVIS